MVEHGGAHLFCITCGKVGVRLVNNPGGFFFEYPRAGRTLVSAIVYRSISLPRASAAYGPDDGPTKFCEQPSLESLFGYPIKVGRNTTIEGEPRSSSDHRCQYAFFRKAARQWTRCRVQALPALHLRPLALCKFADCQLSKRQSIVQRLRLRPPP